jgi:ATP phosphoribosyltransferase
LGLADAVVDLVETGTTMRAAGLDIVTTIMETQTVLISNPKSEHNSLIRLIDARIKGYISATKFQMIQYNVHRDNLDAAIAVTPGKRSPCVIPLDDSEWVAVSALVAKKETSIIMDKLVEVGGQDILLFDLANCRA